MTKVGDIFEIPLTIGKKGYGQYVCRDKMGPMIRVFDLITLESPRIDEIVKSDQRFPPVITGLFAALRTGFWTRIGHKKIESFVYPGFVSTFFDVKTGKARIWFYWDGEKDTRLGTQLPDEYKDKEFLMVWDPHDVVHRIETGEYPFPYRDLILYNKFTPRME
jgi:Immunity protein 26